MMKLSEIAEILKGELVGDSDVSITGLAKIQDAVPGQLTFLANPKYIKYLESTKASAVLVALEQDLPNLPHIKVKDPYLAFLEVLRIYHPVVDFVRDENVAQRVHGNVGWIIEVGSGAQHSADQEGLCRFIVFRRAPELPTRR